MNEDFLDELARFHAYTQAISGLMQEVTQAGPQRTTGRDSTGTVEATITSDGELIDIAIAENWSRSLERDQIGRAVVSAIKDVERRRFEAAMTAAVDNGTIDRLEALSLDDVTPGPLELPKPPRYPTVGTTQLLDETLQAINAGTAREPREFVGEAETEDQLHAIITLNSSGIVDCVVRLPWGIDVSGNAIAWTIKQAHDEARQRLLAVGTHSGATTFDMLITDAIQSLAAMQNRSQGGN